MTTRLANLLRSVACAAAVLLLSVAAQGEEKEHGFIGVKKCGMCHKSEAKGDQLGHWEKSQHSKAYETLASEKALKIAKEKGIEGSPQEADACLKCHVTGHGKSAELFDAAFKVEQGVQCESCHGAGSDYKSIKVMKDREASVAAGLVIPNESTCKTCHNEESPTFKGFDFEKMWAQIQHPNPKNKSASSQ